MMDKEVWLNIMLSKVSNLYILREKIEIDKESGCNGENI